MHRVLFSALHFACALCSASFSTIELLIAKKLNETPNFFEISVNSLTFNFQLLIFNLNGGEYRDRTGDLLLARQALSQLS